jgi:lipopolysaccharide export LptBFGC system permease protein LptF
MRFRFPLRALDRYVRREWLRVFLITLLGFPILVAGGG